MVRCDAMHDTIARRKQSLDSDDALMMEMGIWGRVGEGKWGDARWELGVMRRCGWWKMATGKHLDGILGW